MTVKFVVTDPSDTIAATLMGEMVEEMRSLYEGLDLNDPSMPKGSADVFADEHGGGFLVGWDDDRPVACGGFKRLPDGACEIKRMYVAPGSRGKGVAGRLLAALESLALERGYGIVRLDTGPRQPEVMDMYRRHGYRDIDNFNDNPKATYFGEKILEQDGKHL